MESVSSVLTACSAQPDNARRIFEAVQRDIRYSAAEMVEASYKWSLLGHHQPLLDPIWTSLLRSPPVIDISHLKDMLDMADGVALLILPHLFLRYPKSITPSFQIGRAHV